LAAEWDHVEQRLGWLAQDGPGSERVWSEAGVSEQELTLAAGTTRITDTRSEWDYTAAGGDRRNRPKRQGGQSFTGAAHTGIGVEPATAPLRALAPTVTLACATWSRARGRTAAGHHEEHRHDHVHVGRVELADRDSIAAFVRGMGDGPLTSLVHKTRGVWRGRVELTEEG